MLFRSVMALNNLAWVLAKLKRPGAVVFAERAQAIAPNDAAIKDTLAFVLVQEGKMDLALVAAKAALVLSPEEPVYRLSVARLLLKSGDKPAARRELEPLLKLGTLFDRHKEVAELFGKL